MGTRITLKLHLWPLLVGMSVGVMALAGCGSGSDGTTATVVASAAPATHPGLRVATSISGKADANDPNFVRDQAGLFDPSQLGDTGLYPAGYHWRIDTTIGATGVAAARAVQQRGSGPWVIDVTFTNAAGAEFRAIAGEAQSAPQGSPANRIAFFVGAQVVSAPQVLSSPTGNEFEISPMSNSAVTQSQAEMLASEISPG